MRNYIEENDNVGNLLMSIGFISKGYGGQGQRMGEDESFHVTYRENADPQIVSYFRDIYSDDPKRINFYLPSEDIDKCIVAPYTTFNASRTLLALSDGEYFSYIANLNNPLDTRNPYLRDGRRCSDGERIKHQADLGFLGKPNAKMSMSGQMFVFIKELLEAGVFQTMTVKFSTIKDRDMLRKRLSFTKQYASGIGVSLTAIPFLLTKKKAKTSYIDPSGVAKRAEHYYLDLGMMHSIGSDKMHPLGVALTTSWNSISKNENKNKDNRLETNKNSIVTLQEEDARNDYVEIEEDPDFETEANYEDAIPENIPEQVQPEASEKNEVNGAAEIPLSDKLFFLSEEQKQFVMNELSPLGAKCAVKPEFLSEFKTRNGVAVSTLSFDEIKSQLKLADDYVSKLLKKEISVDKEKETMAKMRRSALITAALVVKNKYVYY